MKITEEAKTIISNPHSHHSYFGWPSIARLQSGALAVVCSGYRMGHVCPFGKLVMALSFDEGRTYTGAFPLIDTPLDDRDAGICVFGENGVIVTSFNNTVKAQKDWNPVSAELDAYYFKRNSYYNAYLNTVSKEEEEKYIGSQFRISFDGGKTFGEIFRSPVTSPHGPTELQDKTLIWVGRNFSEDDKFRENSGIFSFRINLDGTLEELGRVPDVFRDGKKVDLCEPHAIQLPGGRIICHIRTEGSIPFSTFQTISEDNGKTWTQPEQLLSDHGGAPAHLMRHSSGVLISTYGYREAPYGIRAMISENDGKTWKKDIELFTGVSSDIGYPCSVETGDGSIITVFYAKDEKTGPAVIKQTKWEL